LTGINGIVLAARPRSLVLGLLDGILNLLALITLPLILSLHDGERRLNAERL
jgi:hypothetical protein